MRKVGKYHRRKEGQHWWQAEAEAVLAQSWVHCLREPKLLACLRSGGQDSQRTQLSLHHQQAHIEREEKVGWVPNLGPGLRSPQVPMTVQLLSLALPCVFVSRPQLFPLGSLGDCPAMPLASVSPIPVVGPNTLSTQAGAHPHSYVSQKHLCSGKAQVDPALSLRRGFWESLKSTIA